MAPKTKQAEKRRAARLRNKHKQDVDLLEKEELDDEDSNSETEIVEKDYYGDGSMVAMQPGPTSWGELDSLKMAREQADAVREVTWSVQDLVSNILVSSMAPAQKAKAIAEVGNGFQSRVKLAEKHEKMEKQYDMDLLMVKALIARDGRHISLSERASDWLSKMSSLADLPDEDFAIERKLPIHTKAHVRKALSAVVEMIENGGDDESLARSALPKINEAANKFGIGKIEAESSSVVIQKDASGQWRGVMWPTNKFMDYDGEILAEVAHKEYVEWVNENMDCAPVFVIAHTPGTMRKNRVDFVGYESGFLLMSAPLEEHEAALILKAQEHTDIGMSHGTIVLERDAENSDVVTKYRMVEVSDLPLNRAANPFTDFETLVKEADMAGTKMDTKTYLAQFLGEEDAEKFIKKAGLKEIALKEAGVQSKEVSEETPAPAAPAATPALDDVVKQVMEKVSKELDIEGLNDYLSDLQASADKVPVLEALVKELTQSNSDKLAEMIEPPAAKTLVWQKARSSQAKESVLTESEADEKLKKAQPELGWLSETTGTKPVNA